MKFFRGSGRAARAYVEADHHRADESYQAERASAARAGDYYLAEASGIAQLVEVRAATGEVSPVVELDGPTYESWVEGHDALSGEPKGRLRTDDHALRFAEVVVNGPKSWSLAAGLHPQISAAYEAAQHRACEEIGRYVAANATTRLGPRGEQVQVPVDAIEMAMVQHYTSRAGDPHRHIHLQFNARVPIGEMWRGIDSASLLRMQRAINAIGHRAVAGDEGFRQALAAHGYTLNADGEIEQLAAVVPAMSKRTAQVAKNIETYERQWRAEHPDAEPTAAQRRAWDQRAWADARPNKAPRPSSPGSEHEAQWLAELRTLGVDVDAHRAAVAVSVAARSLADVDRDAVAIRALAVLGNGARGRSTWNVFDVRGAVEEVLSRIDVVGDPEAYRALAEDVAAVVVERSLSVVDVPVPDHVRNLTSREVVQLGQEIDERLAVRGAFAHESASVEAVAAALVKLERTRGEALRLDEGQVAAVRAIAGSGPLVFVEGAAGAGKTSTLAAARELIDAQGRSMRVVAPTKKAANVAGAELATDSATAAGLAFGHGFRWDEDGIWTRLTPGEIDPSNGAVYEGPTSAARLTAGEVLVIDEAGMLDQQTARALLRIADESNAHLVFIGDRRQLPAVGIGGTLDKVAKWTPQLIELQSIHRFRRTVDVDGQPVNAPDTQYADLSLQLRSGIDPEQVFDKLHATGHVQLWDSEADALAHLAVTIVDRRQAGETQSVSVATNDTAALINSAVHDRLVDAGQIDMTRHVTGSDGLPIGLGESVMTRHNDWETGVANREIWTVVGIGDDGHLDVIGADDKHAQLPADYITDHVHLAYASTAHGVQGETSSHDDTLLTDATDAAGLYVGMTRGRHSHQVHIVAQNEDQAREQWIAAAGRNRADTGLEQARARALAESAQYARPTQPTQSVQPRRLPGSRRPAAGPSFAERMQAMRDRLAAEIPETADTPTPAPEPVEDEWVSPLERPTHEYDNDPRDRPEHHQRGPRR